MVFSSLVFLFTFLPITLVVYYLAPWKIKNIVLLIASLVFYAWGEPVYIILMLLSITFNYFMGRDIDFNQDEPVKKKRSLILAIVVNIFILGFFKYYVFFGSNDKQYSFNQYSISRAGITNRNLILYISDFILYY